MTVASFFSRIIVKFIQSHEIGELTKEKVILSGVVDTTIILMLHEIDKCLRCLALRTSKFMCSLNRHINDESTKRMCYSSFFRYVTTQLV